jgi:hypothetical protein
LENLPFRGDIEAQRRLVSEASVRNDQGLLTLGTQCSDDRLRPVRVRAVGAQAMPLQHGYLGFQLLFPREAEPATQGGVRFYRAAGPFQPNHSVEFHVHPSGVSLDIRVPTHDIDVICTRQESGLLLVDEINITGALSGRARTFTTRPRANVAIYAQSVHLDTWYHFSP